MRNPYKNIRYFTCNGKYAIMDSEKKEAAIVKVNDELCVYNTLDEAIAVRDKK